MNKKMSDLKDVQTSTIRDSPDMLIEQYAKEGLVACSEEEARDQISAIRQSTNNSIQTIKRETNACTPSIEQLALQKIL